MKNELQGEDLNLRPPHDECGELTNCSTLRYSESVSECVARSL